MSNGLSGAPRRLSLDEFRGPSGLTLGVEPSILTTHVPPRAAAAEPPLASKSRLPATRDIARVVIVFAAIASIKAAFLLLDSRPAYFLGDSIAYLATTLHDYIPPDRSFLYGKLIGLVIGREHLLERLVVFQVLLSTVSACLIPVLLLKIFRTRFWIAALCGILCAIEPLQLSLERYVLTETVANFVFAIYFGLALSYLRAGRFWILAAAACTGALLLSIRISYFPQVLAFSAVLPLLSPYALRFYGQLASRFRRDRSSAPLRTVAVHLCISVLLLQVLLNAYGRWYGALRNTDASIFPQRGDFLLVAFFPIIQASDCRRPAECAPIFDGLRGDYRSLRMRGCEHFCPGQAIDRIKRMLPDDAKRSKFETRLVLRAVEHRPTAVFGLCLQGFLDFFNRSYFLGCVRSDQGENNPLPAAFVHTLEQTLHVSHPQADEPSLTKTWAGMAIPWFWVVLCSLLVSPVLLIGVPRRDLPIVALCVLSALAFFEGATLTIEYPTARFLISGAWLTLLMAGNALERCIPGVIPGQERSSISGRANYMENVRTD